MQTAQEIYQITVSRLPPEERLQLASLILSELAKQDEKLSATELLKSFPPGRGFENSEEVESYLRQERDSWDR
jgi:hypothetical protein